MNVLEINTAVSYLPFSSNPLSSTVMFWESRYYILNYGKRREYDLSLIFVFQVMSPEDFSTSLLSLKADLLISTTKRLGVLVTSLIYTTPSQRSKLSGRT